MQRLRLFFSHFWSNHDGSIAIIAAICLPIIIGFVALSVEYGYGLAVRDANQRTADLVSYAAALAYNDTHSKEQMMVAALSVARLNGLDSPAVTVSVTSSPKDAQQEAVHVEIKTINKLYLAPVLGVGHQLDIAVEAYSSLGESGSACIIALDKKGSGLTLSGGVQVGSPGCYVASNSDVNAPCGTMVTAKSISYFDGSSQPCPWAKNLVNGNGDELTATQKYTSDPLEGHDGVAALSARFDAIRKAVWPAKVSVSTGQDIEFGGSSSPLDTAKAISKVGCQYDPNYYDRYWTVKWVITCSGSEVRVGSLLVHGNVQVWFNVSGNKSTTYDFSGRIQNDFGTKLVFGNGTFNVAKGVYGADLTFGAGSFHFGMGDWKCGDAHYSLCASGNVVIDGPSKFIFDAGFYTGAGAKLKLGEGTSNSYIIGKSSGDNAIGLDGGSITVIADASAVGGVFRLDGDLGGGGGGSCITIPASTEHDISGNVNLAGGARLGAGTYTIDGYFSVNTGGSACSSNVAVSGEDVTIVVSGLETPSDWECRGKSFCLTGGNAITLNAPKDGPNAELAVVGPQSTRNTTGAEITSGGTARISGAFYFPNGEIDFGGGGNLGDAGNGCLQLIGSSISLSGGAQAMSECSQLGFKGKVAIIQ